MTQRQTVLLVGGTGRTGRHVLRELLRPGGLDTRRSAPETAFLRALGYVLPPVKDNQRAADFLRGSVGASNPFVQWTVVRPDTLLPGDVSEYAVHEGLVDSLFSPGSTNMANAAHFMCELVEKPATWADWKGKMPVVVNAGATSGAVRHRG